MIELTGIEKIYVRGAERVHALKGVDLSIRKGEFLAITGPSGSGKTTLLHILGCLDKATRGVVKYDGLTISNMKDSELVKLRREKIGFVFQQFYLIPGLTVIENVTLPLLFGRKNKQRSEVLAVLEMVGLQDKFRRTPSQLSGGEMQRVAIARALINNPQILLADEPTGNLDTENSEKIFEILKSCTDRGITVVIVTHNNELAIRAERIVRLKDGKLISY